MEDLRALRKLHGLKGYEVAEILGYTPEHISRCENGKRRLSAVAMRTLRHALAEYPIKGV
jgi:transcriptional regulator with XRE-family HTH domain